MGDDDDIFDDLIDPFDLFDVDGDGKYSSVEKVLAIDEFERDERAAENGFFDEDKTEDTGDDDDYDIEQILEAAEYGINPSDYETEEDFLEALKEAKDEQDVDGDGESDGDDDGLTDTDSTGFTDSIPENLPERLQEIYDTLEYSDNPDELKRCKFIISHQDVTEMRYVNANGYILYGQYANENFDLPVKFKVGKASTNLSFCDIFHRIARHNPAQALDFWKYCFEHFMPYSEYLDPYESKSLTDIGLQLRDEGSDALKGFAALLSSDGELFGAWLRSFKDVPFCIETLVTEMLVTQKPEAAKSIVARLFSVPDVDYADTEEQIESIVRNCTATDDLTAANGFIEHLVPIIERLGDKPILRRVPEWVSEIKDHIDYVESTDPQYAYSGKNAWRLKYKDSHYDADPTEYDCEADFLSEVEPQADDWKDKYASDNCFGVDITTFENESDFLDAVHNAKAEHYKRLHDEKVAKREAVLKDKTVYTYYGVLISSDSPPYHYFSHEPFSIGDTVIVPAGDSGNELKGTVVSVSQHLRVSAPFPPEKTKYIIKRADKT